jgi:hypothetical protein
LWQNNIAVHRSQKPWTNIGQGTGIKGQLGKIMNRADRAFWIHSGTFGKIWGLKPKAVYWIYSIVVRPIITYATTMWCRLKYKTSRAKLSKLQRLACLRITVTKDNSSYNYN